MKAMRAPGATLRHQLDLGDRGHVEADVTPLAAQGLDDPRRRVGLHGVEDVALKILLEPARR